MSTLSPARPIDCCRFFIQPSGYVFEWVVFIMLKQVVQTFLACHTENEITAINLLNHMKQKELSPSVKN